MYIIFYHSTSFFCLSALSPNEAVAGQRGKDRVGGILRECLAPRIFALSFTHSGTSVISLMRINNHGSYLALNDITSHPFWVGVQHNCCFFWASAQPSFPGLIMYSWHIMCWLTLKSKLHKVYSWIPKLSLNRNAWFAAPLLDRMLSFFPQLCISWHSCSPLFSLRPFFSLFPFHHTGLSSSTCHLQSPVCMHYQSLTESNLCVCVCVQVHCGGDARPVQHHPPLQEESLCDDCHRVGPGLRRLLSAAVWFQHHRSAGVSLHPESRLRQARCGIVVDVRVSPERDLKVHRISLACQSQCACQGDGCTTQSGKVLCNVSYRGWGKRDWRQRACCSVLSSICISIIVFFFAKWK